MLTVTSIEILPSENSPRKSGVWTEERIDLLKQLLADGLSSSQIAAQLGGGLTRNAVIGKVHRLRLPPTKPRSPRPRKARAKRKRLVLKAPMQPDDDAAIPFEQRVTLEGLTASTCRWPVGEPGEPDFFFCGGEAMPNKPYCWGHCQKAYDGFRHKNARPVAYFTFRRDKAA